MKSSIIPLLFALLLPVIGHAEMSEPEFPADRIDEAVADSNCALAKKLLKPFVDQNHKVSLSALARWHHFGVCVDQNIEKSLEFYERAVKAGYCEMEARIGLIYLRGIDIAINTAEAQRRFNKAAICFAPALHAPELDRYSLTLVKGVIADDYIPPEFKKELEWVIRVNHGDPQTQFDLAMKLIQGTWLPKNLKTAYYWLHRAANKKHIEANYVLGKALLDGSLNEKDPSMGRWMLYVAAEKNHADAQLSLGKHYAVNLHKNRYGIHALYWLWRAEKSGKAVSAELIETIKASMTDRDKVFARITIESGAAPFPR
jgi:hypothetical protein